MQAMTALLLFGTFTGSVTGHFGWRKSSLSSFMCLTQTSSNANAEIAEMEQKVFGSAGAAELS